jgi:hypothetical protein
MKRGRKNSWEEELGFLAQKRCKIEGGKNRGKKILIVK